MSRISPYNSSKLKVLSMLLILMVVFIHSAYKEGNDYAVVNYFQNLFSGYALCRVANPLFFMISGYLFFHNVRNMADIFPKIRKRIYSLLIPYIIWNIIFVLWYIFLSYVPQAANSVNSDVLQNFNSIESGLFFLFIKPANFPLWFLRNLIVFIAFTPLIWVIISKIRWFSMIIFFAVAELVPFGGILWFTIGASVAILSSLESIEYVLTKKKSAFCIAVYIISSLWIAHAADIQNFKINYLLGLIFGFCSFIAIWRGYDFIANGRILTNLKYIRLISGYSFFIFVFHEPTFNIIKKVPLMIFGQSEATILIFYLINPFIMCIVAISVAKILQLVAPGLYSVLVGGR